MSGDFSIGSSKWAGAGKIVEESGELNTIIGKLIATEGDSAYYDGRDLSEEALDEAADLAAAIEFFVFENFRGTSQLSRFAERKTRKLTKFREWHRGLP